MTKTLVVAGRIFLLNLPFGYWRGSGGSLKLLEGFEIEDERRRKG